MRYLLSGSAVLNVKQYQHGAALVVSLIILLVMTLIGITSLRTTTMEERMAGNMRDRLLAFESAEAGLRFAETYIRNFVFTLGSFDQDGSDGLYSDAPLVTGKEIWEVIDWSGVDSSNSYKARVADKLDGINTAPKFVVQYYGSIELQADLLNLNNYGTGVGAGEVQMFMITVRATGGSDNAAVVLQTSYGKLL
jgi:type IV pilus assembly protein PilX